MLWRTFCSKGVLNLVEHLVRVSSGKHISIAKSNAIPFAQEKHCNLHLHQEGDASIHASSKTRTFAREASAAALKWPACSPDQNPIESVWSYLLCKICANGRQCSSVKELRKVVHREWNNIPQSHVQKLVDSMVERCMAALEKKGKLKH